MKSTVLLALFLALTLFAQTPANSRLVEVSVIVRDKSGPVTGLTAADFELFDKGKEQKIAGVVAGGSQTPPAAPLSPNVFANRDGLNAVRPGITVILLDSLNTPANAQTYARAQFSKAIKAVKPEDRVAIYLLGSELHAFPSSRDEGVTVESWLAEHAFTGTDAIPTRLHATANALITLCNRFGQLPGRKNLVWIAGSYPVSVDHFGAQGPPGWENTAAAQPVGGGFNQPTVDPTMLDRAVFEKAFAPAMQALNFANLSIYPVDDCGASCNSVSAPQNTASTASRRGGASVNNPTDSGGAQTVTDPLRVLAADTGGRTYQGGADLDKAVRAIISDAAASYTLAYYPDPKMLDSRFHDLKVQVKRKDVDVHLRKGYVALPPRKIGDAERSEILRETLLDATPNDAIGILGAYQKLSQQKAGSLEAAFVVSVADLDFTAVGDQFRGEVEYFISPRDADGKDLGAVRQAIGLKLSRDQYDTAMVKGISFSKVLEPKGETAEIRAVVIDRTTGKAGSLTMPVK